MKTRIRFSVFTALCLLLLALVLVSERWIHEIPPQEISTVSIAPVSSRGSEQLPTRSEPRATATTDVDEDSVWSNQMRQARGAGYLWGKALNTVYAATTLSAEGKRRLDVTELERSFKGFVRPVNLEDTSASPQARAEYLAAVITTALDLSASWQPDLTRVLEDYYAADSSSGAQDSQRAQLSRQARDVLVALLPPESAEQFRIIFNTPDFLFRSMFIVADEITLANADGSMLATGEARFTIKNNGALGFTANGMKTRVSEGRSKPRRSNP
jgi:hypothetical protein